MLTLIEQIRNGVLWDFPGGVHPAENKKQSNKTQIAYASIPSEIVLPVKQHIGRAGKFLVNIGDSVLKGQALTDSDTGFTLPVHAPTSGQVVAIEPRTVAHPSGLTEPCIVIMPDGEDTWIEKTPLENFAEQTPEALIDAIRLAGISGMGGAGFPTAKKIQSGLARTEVLIVNAAECEPYITADDTLMQFYAEEIIKGIEVVEHILKPKVTIIGIEDNKPEAIRALEVAAKDKELVIRVIPTKYPSGGEKQLIKILTNQEVPKGAIPADIGILVQNVGSLYAIKRAIIDGEPMTNRVVTLTGKTFKKPCNVWALLGTPVQSLLDEFGYKEEKKLPRLIMGGPMMGFTLPHSHVPITKTSNCILAPKKREISAEQDEMECIRCGQCAEACPVSLLPQQMLWHSKSKEYDKLEELNLKDCIECGACAYICPSQIPLVQYYRQSKAEIRSNEAEAAASERAKQRFEAKNARMERDKAERENRFKKAASDRRKEMKTSGGDDAIAAAIARVKAQKAAAESQEPTVKPAVAAAIARAKAKQAAAQSAAQPTTNEPDNSEVAKLREERKRLARERKAQKEQDTAETTADDKHSAVAAAIARAKARKAAQAMPSQADSLEDNPKKAAVAAAIARAKARKTEESVDGPSDVVSSDQVLSDAKKAAVADAIARAKARKAEKAESESQTASVQASDNPKKDAVAAVIARAKARKAEKETVEPTGDHSSEKESDDPKKAAVAAAIARAKARKAAKETVEPVDESSSEQVSDDPKKVAVAAAIARAKARKAAKETVESTDENSSEQESDDPKKAAVAAAIARAKARKATKETAESSEENSPEQEESDDPKKAAVAAAIARAKARKAAKETAESSEENSSEQESDDPKKAAVAAAIARAKARKAKKEADNKNKESD